MLRGGKDLEQFLFILLVYSDIMWKLGNISFYNHIWTCDINLHSFLKYKKGKTFLSALILIIGSRYCVCLTRSVLLNSFWTRCSLIKAFHDGHEINRQVLPKERTWNKIWPFLISWSDLWNEIQWGEKTIFEIPCWFCKFAHWQRNDMSIILRF